MLEEEIAVKSNYATTAEICVGESFGAKTSFEPELLENPERTDSNEIRSTAEGIREATGWEYPVDNDRKSIRSSPLGHNRTVGSSTENRNEREGT